MNNPIKDEKDPTRIIRGGDWGYYPSMMRASSRSGGDPTTRDNYLGFRIVRNK